MSFFIIILSLSLLRICFDVGPVYITSACYLDSPGFKSVYPDWITYWFTLLAAGMWQDSALSKVTTASPHILFKVPFPSFEASGSLKYRYSLNQPKLHVNALWWARALKCSPNDSLQECYAYVYCKRIIGHLQMLIKQLTYVLTSQT